MEVNFQRPVSQFALLLSAEKQLGDVLFEEQRMDSIEEYNDVFNF